MADTAQALARKEKIGYAMSDIATNFFFQSMILYQTRFYTTGPRHERRALLKPSFRSGLEPAYLPDICGLWPAACFCC